MAEGLRYVLGNPILRGIVAAATTHNLGSMMVNTLYLLFAYRQLGLSPGVVGGLFAMGGVGSLAGALMSSTVTRLLGVGPTLVVTQLLTGIAYLLVPAAGLGFPLILLGVSAVLLGVQRPIFNVTQVSLRQAITPDRLRGRMTATIRTIIWGVYPAGALAGGFVAATLGIPVALLIGGSLPLLASGWLLARPLISLRKHPGQTAIPPG